MIKNFVLLLMAVSLIACNNKNNSQTGSENTSGNIKRYEVALFSIDTNNFEKGVTDIHPDFKVFLGNEVPDAYGMQQLKDFVTDPQIREIYDYTIKQFPDVQWLDEGFSKAFNNLKKEYPDKVVPQVYTYVSGFDIQMPIKYSDSALIIGLDLYLGPDYAEYPTLGYPKYIIEKLSKEYILPDSFKEIGWSLLPDSQPVTVLDNMIEQGKIIYFAEAMLADAEPGHLMKYTNEQIEWVTANAGNIWSFIIENQLLYSSDAKAISMFMTDGPFTSGFAEDSPSRTGHWLGWQIVRSYMQNQNVTLQELMKDRDAQKILQQSGFKPSKI